jgi:P-type Cu+ transporter
VKERPRTPGSRPRVTDFLACADFGDDETLRLVASAMLSSQHALAAAVVDSARERGLRLSSAAVLDEIPGHGLHARVDGHELWIGDLAFVRERGWQEAPLATLDRYAAMDKDPLLAAIDGLPGAIMAIAHE